MPYRFLNDIIRSSWSDHGDNTLYDIMNSELSNNRYLLPIDQALWKNHLEEWIDEQMRSPLKSFSADVKLFHAYVLNAMGQSTSERYYVQHIIPKKVVLDIRSEEHTSELQSRPHLVCRLLLEKKKKKKIKYRI